MKTLLKSRAAVAVATAVIAAFGASFFLASRSPRQFPQTTLIDGTRIRFLGVTFGTDHWNPAAPAMVRWLARWPPVASRVVPHLPSQDGRRPHRAFLSPQWGACPVLWLYSPDSNAKRLQLVIRCFDRQGNEVASARDANFDSTTNAMVVPFMGLDQQKFARVQYIEFHELQSHDILPDTLKDLSVVFSTYLGRIELPQPK